MFSNPKRPPNNEEWYPEYLEEELEDLEYEDDEYECGGKFKEVIINDESFYIRR